MFKIVSITDNHTGFERLIVHVEGELPANWGTLIESWPNKDVSPGGTFVWSESDDRIMSFGFKSNGMQTGHGGLWSSRAQVLGHAIGEPCLDINNGLGVRVSDIEPMLPDWCKVEVDDEWSAKVVFINPPEDAYSCKF